MLRAATILVSATIIIAAPIGAATMGPARRSWNRLPPTPVAVTDSAAWTGTELLLFGRTSAESADVLEAYNPRVRSWHVLPAPPKSDNYCRRGSAWTGRELLVWGCAQLAFDPTSEHWRRLAPAPTGQGVVVWTGHELIGWGGGCCGDAWDGGSAYDVATSRWRTLPRSPLGAAQRPLGAWTGKEVVLVVSGFDSEGDPYPRRLARAAAYNPSTNRWRRLPPLPQASLRFAGGAAWTGRELLVVATGARSRSTYALNPSTNRWRRLAPLPTPRSGPSVLWTGSRLIVWGGQNLSATAPLRDGVEYDPRHNRWSPLPQSPLRRPTTAAWAARSLFVFDGRGAAVLGR